MRAGIWPSRCFPGKAWTANCRPLFDAWCGGTVPLHSSAWVRCYYRWVCCRSGPAAKLGAYKFRLRWGGFTAWLDRTGWGDKLSSSGLNAWCDETDP